MSFKLKNVLIIFQKLINDMLRKYFNNFIIIYLNDILIYLDKKKPRQQQHTQQTERIAKLIKVEY